MLEGEYNYNSSNTTPITTRIIDLIPALPVPGAPKTLTVAVNFVKVSLKEAIGLVTEEVLSQLDINPDSFYLLFTKISLMKLVSDGSSSLDLTVPAYGIIKLFGLEYDPLLLLRNTEIPGTAKLRISGYNHENAKLSELILDIAMWLAILFLLGKVSKRTLGRLVNRLNKSRDKYAELERKLSDKMDSVRSDILQQVNQNHESVMRGINDLSMYEEENQQLLQTLTQRTDESINFIKQFESDARRDFDQLASLAQETQTTLTSVQQSVKDIVDMTQSQHKEVVDSINNVLDEIRSNQSDTNMAIDNRVNSASNRTQQIGRKHLANLTSARNEFFAAIDAAVTSVKADVDSLASYDGQALRKLILLAHLS